MIMTNKITYSLTENSLTVVTKQGKVYTVIKNNETEWKNVLFTLKTNDETQLISLINKLQAIKTAVDKTPTGNGNIVVKGEIVYYKNRELHGLDVTRLLAFVAQDLPTESLVNFLEKKLANPSKHSIDQLYTFLEHGNMPLTPDGNFLGYKGITNDYHSIRTGKEPLLQGRRNESGQIANFIGEIVEMSRNDVDDDFTHACSGGLHVGTLKYATDYAGSSGRVIIVEVNPADVVSVPRDCDGQKLRCSKYKVVAEYKFPLNNEYVDTQKDINDVDNKDTSKLYISDDTSYDEGYNDGFYGHTPRNLSSLTHSAKYISNYKLGFGDGEADKLTHD